MEKEARKKKSLRWYGREIRKNRDNYLMVAPYAVIFTVFTVIPVVLAIVMSFTYFNLLEPPQFRGLFNYMRLFLDDDVFWLSMKNTLIFALLTGPLSYFLCLVCGRATCSPWCFTRPPSRGPCTLSGASSSAATLTAWPTAC